jgi:hypothetical protein
VSLCYDKTKTMSVQINIVWQLARRYGNAYFREELSSLARKDDGRRERYSPILVVPWMSKHGRYDTEKQASRSQMRARTKRSEKCTSSRPDCQITATDTVSAEATARGAVSGDHVDVDVDLDGGAGVGGVIAVVEVTASSSFVSL